MKINYKIKIFLALVAGILIASLIVFGTNLAADKILNSEISKIKYEEINKWEKENPSISKEINKSLTDGQITNSEYREIEKKHNAMMKKSWFKILFNLE